MEIHVQNIVASISTDQQFDLDMIHEKVSGSEYSPEKFPGLIYKLKEPKTALLIFKSGKLVCTGAKTVEKVYEAVDKVRKKLAEIGMEVIKDPKIAVQNIVATSDLKKEINLNTIAITLGLENVEYEPEQFPGLVYRVKDPRAVALLFGTGKVVCTGTKDIKDIEKALSKIEAELTNANLI
ncbi:MAG: TATA-box-binding protein [Candidatus Thermoplasmatota archaeon]|nr:TATA-box-binding protein [Candidatus Thermoplasmatota archaeon]